MGCAKTIRFHFPCRKCDSLDDFGVIALRNTRFLGVYIIPFPPESASFDKVLWRRYCPMGRHWPCPSSLDMIRRRTHCAYASFHVNTDFPWPHLIFRRYWRLEVSMNFSVITIWSSGSIWASMLQQGFHQVPRAPTGVNGLIAYGIVRRTAGPTVQQVGSGRGPNYQWLTVQLVVGPGNTGSCRANSPKNVKT